MATAWCRLAPATRAVITFDTTHRMPTMKIATWNVNGIRARQAQLHEWIEREQPDVICLQEIKATRRSDSAALCDCEGYWCYWHGDEGLLGRGACT